MSSHRIILYSQYKKYEMVSIKDKVEYIVALVNEFAKRFGLTDVQAFRYINYYNGIDLIEQHYNIMHTLDFNEIVDCVASYCKQQGGALV